MHHEGAARKAALSLKIERKRVAMVVERFCGCVFGCLRVDRSPFPMTAIWRLGVLGLNLLLLVGRGPVAHNLAFL